MLYVLGTNIVSDLVRIPNGVVAGHVAEVGEDQVCTRMIFAAELRYRAAKKNSVRLTAQQETVFSAIEIIPFDESTDAAYVQIRTAIEDTGMPIGANDLLNAAHDLALDYVLVADNQRECSRVPGLACENRLRPSA